LVSSRSRAFVGGGVSRGAVAADASAASADLSIREDDAEGDRRDRARAHTSRSSSMD